MKYKKYRKSGSSKRLLVVSGTVDFVNNRNIRVRTANGVTYRPEIGRFSDLLPTDTVEIEVIPARGNRSETSRIISVEWSPCYQIVALVQKRRVRGKYGQLLFPVGIGIDNPIEVVDNDTASKHGEYVIATVERFSTQPKSFKLIEIQKRLENVRELANAVAMSRFGLSREWPAEVSSEVEDLRDDICEEDLVARDDLRRLPFVTIDPATAKDHDDAVFCERLDDDNFRLMVAIADVSHYVRPNTRLDSEARSRGTSIYLIEDVIPMLPELLSNNICSLESKKDRLALVCDMTISSDGIVIDYEFKEAVINSRVSLSYDAVEEKMHGNELPQAVNSNLQCLFEVHQRLMKARTERGTLEVDLPESELNITDSGAVGSIGKTNRVLSHSLVEEAMLAANVCAAKLIDKHYSGNAMFRVHDEPTRRDIEELNGILDDFGVKLPVDRKAKIADYDTIRSNLFQHKNIFLALQTHILRSLSTAVYSATCRPHFALSYPKYTHFTSPIRRCPDILVHRLIKGVLRKKKSTGDKLKLDGFATRCSYLERRADSCVRESEKWLKADYMKNCVDEIYDGIVVEIRSFGVFVQLDEPYVSGMIPTYKLGVEYFHYDSIRRQLIGEKTRMMYSIGMPLRVRVSDADPENGFIDFELSESDWKKVNRIRRRRNKR